MALRLGWRSIDCAYEYGTQNLVAAGIAASGVDRSEIFLETKIPGPVGAHDTVALFEADLRALNTTTVDLLLMHYPCTPDFPQPRDGCTVDEGAGARRETWHAMELLVTAGKARRLGVSNFKKEHLQQLLSFATQPVAVNQVQWHLGFHDDDLLGFCQSHGIQLQAYSPLGGGGTSTGRDGGISIDDPVVAQIATRHNKSNAQIALRWSIDRGVAVVTSSVRPEYLMEDLAVLDFALQPAEVAALSGLRATVPSVRIVDDWPDVMMPQVALACNGGGGGSDADDAGQRSMVADMLAWARAGGRHFSVPAAPHAVLGAKAGLKAVLAAGIASRRELFVTARVPAPLGYAATLQWVNTSWLGGGDLAWVDLLLLGAPCRDGGTSCGSADGDRAAVLSTWRALVALRVAKHVRAIGVRNFSVQHLAWIVGEGGGSGRVGGLILPGMTHLDPVGDDPPANMSAPSVNEVEFHIGNHDDALRVACARANVTLLAASPPFQRPIPRSAGGALAAAAAAHGKTQEQIALRYSLQQTQGGVVVLPGGRLGQFLAPLFNFSLSPMEMNELGLQ